MKVKSLIMQITPGASPDQVGYKLYMEEAPAPVTYESQAWTLGPETEVDISTLEGMTTKNGVYNFGLVTVDGAGNESSMLITEGVAVDFVAPDPPQAVEFVRS
jgi:hypothetical protein